MCGFGSLALLPNTSLQSSLNLSTAFTGGDSAVPPISPVCTSDKSSASSQPACIFPSSVTYRSSPLRPSGAKWPSSGYTLETIPADQMAVATQVELSAPPTITSPVISATAPSLSPSRHTGRCATGGVTRATSLLGVLTGRNNSSHTTLPVIAINTSVVQRIGPLLKRSRVSTRNTDTLYCPPRSLLVRPRPKARSSVPSRPRRAFAANNVQPSASITSSPAVATVALSMTAQSQSNQIHTGLEDGAESSSQLSEAVRSQKPIEFDPDSVPSPRLNSLQDSQLSASESGAAGTSQHSEIVANTTKQPTRPSLRSTRRLASPTAAMRTIRQLMASSRRSPVSAPRIVKRTINNTPHSPVNSNAKESAYLSKAFGFAKQFSSRWPPQSRRKPASTNEPSCVPLQLFPPPPVPFSSPNYVFKPHALMEHDYTRHVFGYFLQAQATSNAASSNASSSSSSPSIGTCALSLATNVVVPASLIPRVMHDTAAPIAREDAAFLAACGSRAPHQRSASTASGSEASGRSLSPSKAKRVRRSPNGAEHTPSAPSPKAPRSPRAHNASVTSQPTSPHKQQRRFIFDSESDSEEDMPLDKLLERVTASSQQSAKGVKRCRRKELETSATVGSPIKRLRGSSKKADNGSGGKMANVTAHMENEVLRLLEQQERSRLGARSKFSDEFVYYGVPSSTSTSPSIQQHSPQQSLALRAHAHPDALDALEPLTDGATSTGGAQNNLRTRAALRSRGQAAAEASADPNKSSEWMPGIDPAYFEFKSRKTAGLLQQSLLPPPPPPLLAPLGAVPSVQEMASVTTLSQAKIGLLTSPGAAGSVAIDSLPDSDPMAELDTKHVIDAILQAEAMAKAADPLAGLALGMGLGLGMGMGMGLLGGPGPNKSVHDLQQLQHDVDNKPLELSGLDTDSVVVPLPLGGDAHDVVDLSLSDVVGLHLCPSVGVPDCILGMLASGEVQSAAAQLPNVTSASVSSSCFPPLPLTQPAAVAAGPSAHFPTSPLLDARFSSLNEHNISTYAADALSLSSLFTPTSPPTQALAFLPQPQPSHLSTQHLMLGDLPMSMPMSMPMPMPMPMSTACAVSSADLDMKALAEPVEASMAKPQLDYSLSSSSSGAFSCATSEFSQQQQQQQQTADLKFALCSTLPTPAQTPTPTSSCIGIGIGEVLGFSLPLSACGASDLFPILDATPTATPTSSAGQSQTQRAGGVCVLPAAGAIIGCSAAAAGGGGGSVESGVASAVSRGASQSGASTSDSSAGVGGCGEPGPDAHMYRTPELTTVNMFWNDLPALLIDRYEYIRLVDLHRQVRRVASRCVALRVDSPAPPRPSASRCSAANRISLVLLLLLFLLPLSTILCWLCSTSVACQLSTVHFTVLVQRVLERQRVVLAGRTHKLINSSLQ